MKNKRYFIKSDNKNQDPPPQKKIMRFGNIFVSLLDQLSWKSFHQIIEAGTRMTEKDRTP